MKKALLLIYSKAGFTGSVSVYLDNETDTSTNLSPTECYLILKNSSVETPAWSAKDFVNLSEWQWKKSSSSSIGSFPFCEN
jgi:hypothetical protein